MSGSRAAHEVTLKARWSERRGNHDDRAVCVCGWDSGIVASPQEANAAAKAHLDAPDGEITRERTDMPNDTVSRADYEAMMAARDGEKANHERVAAMLTRARDRSEAGLIARYFKSADPHDAYEDAIMEVVAVHEMMAAADAGRLDLDGSGPIRGLAKAEAKRLLPVAVDLATYALAVMRGDIEASDQDQARPDRSPLPVEERIYWDHTAGDDNAWNGKKVVCWNCATPEERQDEAPNIPDDLNCARCEIAWESR